MTGRVIASVGRATHADAPSRAARACACGTRGGAAVIQRCAANGEPGCACGVEEALSDPGFPLDPLVRADMEHRFRADFSHVRIHTGPAATVAAERLNARAFTVGRHVVFRQAEYAPDRRAGIHLLGHELGHVVQDGTAAPATGSSLVLAGLSAERLAERAAADVSAGRAVSLAGSGPRAGSSRGHVVGRQQTTDSARQAFAKKIERIDSLLSYSVSDWAITDREATEAFALLRSMSQPERAAAVRRIRLDRLIENLPRRHQVELAVLLVAALPPEQVAHLIGRSLETSFTDWFVTEDDAVQALNLLEALPGEQRDRVFDGLVRSGRRRLWNALPDRLRARADQIWEEKQQRIYERQLREIGQREHPETARATAGKDAVERKRQEFMRWLSPGGGQSVDQTSFPVALEYIRWVERHGADPEFLRITPWQLYEQVATTVRQRRASEVDTSREAVADRQRQLREQSQQDLARWTEYQDFIRQRMRRIGELNETEARVQEDILRRFIAWVQANHNRPAFRRRRPLEVYEEIGRGVITPEIDRAMLRAAPSPQDDQSRRAKQDEFMALAMRLRRFHERFPYVIPVPSQHRDILVWGSPALEEVLNTLADELSGWSFDHYMDGDFTSSSPAAVLLTLVRLHEAELHAAQLEPVVAESIARTDIDWSVAARSFAGAIGKALLIVGIAGLVVGAELLTAGQVTWIFVGLAGYMGVQAYRARRAELTAASVDLPPAETVVHAAGDVIGLSQFVEGLTGVRLGTGQQLGSEQRSEALGEGAGAIASVFVGSRAFRAGQVGGRAWRASTAVRTGGGGAGGPGAASGGPSRLLPGPAEDFPFGGGMSPLPVPEVPNRVYRIMGLAEAAEAMRTNQLPGQATGTMNSKFVSLDSRYSVLFREGALDQLARRGTGAAAQEANLAQLEARLAEVQASGDSARAAQLEQRAVALRERIQRDAAVRRSQAETALEDWYRAPGQKVVVEIELQPGAIEHMLNRGVFGNSLSRYAGRDVYIWKFERGYGRNIGVPDWQLANFNRMVVRIRFYAERGLELVGPRQMPGRGN